jgi:hypothetical protein
MFEFAHVWIFVIMILFVVHAAIFMQVSGKANNHWHTTDKMDVHTLIAKYDFTLYLSQ